MKCPKCGHSTIFDFTVCKKCGYDVKKEVKNNQEPSNAPPETKFNEKSKMEISITNSNKVLSEIAADFAKKSIEGEIIQPQIWLLMMNESQAKTLITKYATSAESLFVKSPEVVNLSDGKTAICFTLLNAIDIRKLVDILTNSVRIRCSGFVIQLPESDRSYLLQKISNTGEGVNIGKLISFT